MPKTTDEALREVEAALITQNQRFAALVEAFSELPSDTRIDVDAAIMDAIEATTHTPTIHANARSINVHPNTLGALRA